MTRRQMYNNRYNHMLYAVLIVNDAAKPIGNSAIAKQMNLSRQAVNEIMQDAALYGYVNVHEIDWRPNVKAKRYTIGAYAVNVVANRKRIEDKFYNRRRRLID